MTKWTIGITGGVGYVGSSLGKHFSKAFRVKLIDIIEPREDFGSNVRFQYCDVRNYDEVKNAFRDVDLVIHTSIIQIPAITEFKKLAYEVNLLGTQNICKAVEEVSRVKGLILSGSWHTIGERELKGVIDEAFGFHPDKVEARARLYALSKMAQEATVRFFDEMTTKIYGIIRMGTVLGEGMPEKTAANIFIENGLLGKTLTPFKQSMYRPMLYVDINDICKAYEIFAKKIFNNEIKKDGNSMADIFNVYYPEAITIYQLANFTRDEIIKQTKGKIKPEVKIIDNGEPSLFNENDKKLIQVDASKAIDFLGVKKLKSPEESIREIISGRINKSIL